MDSAKSINCCLKYLSAHKQTITKMVLKQKWMREEPQHKETEAVSTLANWMCLGPFPGTEASWQGAAWIHSVKLSYSPKQGGHMEAGAGSSPWPMVLLNPTQKLCGRELLGTIQNVPRSVLKILWYRGWGALRDVPGAVQCSGIDVAWKFQPMLWTRRKISERMGATPPFLCSWLGAWEHISCVLCRESLAGRSFSPCAMGGRTPPLERSHAEFCQNQAISFWLVFFLSIAFPMTLVGL